MDTSTPSLIPAHEPSAAAQAAIRKVLDDRAAAFRTKDAEGIVAKSTPDMIAYTLAPPLKIEPTIAGLKAWLNTWKGGLIYEMRDVSIEAGDEVAFATSFVRMGGEKTSGTQAVLWQRVTTGFRKISGVWWIVHEHASVPFYMDGSLKAAVDLEP
jgi:PhnB protein